MTLVFLWQLIAPIGLAEQSTQLNIPMDQLIQLITPRDQSIQLIIPMVQSTQPITLMELYIF